MVEDYANTMLRNAFMPTIVLPTRITSYTCTSIDHIFYYSKHFRNNLFSGNLFVDITDHFANLLIIGPKKKKQNRPYVRIFSDKNKEKFKNSLSIIKWNEELRNKNTSQAMPLFYEQLTQAYSKSFPFMRKSKKRMNDKPWRTKGLKHCIKKKHLLYCIYILNQTEENSSKYKTYNDKIRSILRQDENNY